MTAKRKNKIARVYTGPEEFWKVASALPKDTPIYVDSNLGDGFNPASRDRRRSLPTIVLR